MATDIVNLDALSRNWWVLLLRGLAGVAFGIAALLAPSISLAALILLFGAYALADGVLAIGTAWSRRRSGHAWWVFVIEGLVGIAAGVFTFMWPGVTALALVFLISIWALVTGVIRIATAVRLRRVIAHEWLLATSGLLSLAFGVLLLLAPRAGALALVLWLGAFALVFGVLLIALSFRLRAWASPSDREAAAPLSHPRSAH